MLNRMVPIPHSYLYHTWKNRQNNFCIFFKILDFSQKPSKKVGKKTQRGGLYPLGSTFNAESNGTNPPLVSLLHVEKSTKQFLYFFQNSRFFSKTVKKKSGKNPAWGGLYPLGSTFNAESNGTNPPLVSLLYVKKSTKQFLCFFQIFRFFQKPSKESRENKKPSVGSYTP